MSLLAFALMAPWLLVLAFLYWRFPRSLPETRKRRAFDVVTVIAALAVALAVTGLAHYGYEPPLVDQFGQRTGRIWFEVLAALFAYAGFLTVLVVAFGLRHALWRRQAES